MNRLLVEIKARCHDPEEVRHYLRSRKATFRGIDHQVDTYFVVPNGRLKLREGEIEKSLIFYERNNQKGPKDSHVSLSRFEVLPASLSTVLTDALGVKTVVDKTREIYFIDNVKFHIDEVKKLGSFVEIEAIGRPGVHQQSDLLRQCNLHMTALNIQQADLLADSYSDQILAINA